MRSITSLIVMSSVAFFAQAYSSVGTLNTFYSGICKGIDYSAVTGSNQVNYEPWEFIKGYALGTQVNISDTSSTCYGQVNQTFDFVNAMVDSGYSWAQQILSMDFSTSSANAQNMF
jgi:hypothetical protein